MCHLGTLKQAFGLRVPKKYRIEQIMADELHMVALSRLGRKWFVSIFDLQATSHKATVMKTNKARVFLAERHVRLDVEALVPPSVFLFNDWLVFHIKNELAWFDKKGKRSATSPKLNNISNERAVYISCSNLLFVLTFEILDTRRLIFRYINFE